MIEYEHELEDWYDNEMASKFMEEFESPRVAIDEFIEWVETGYVIACDGCGYLVKNDIEEANALSLNKEFLLQAKANGFTYVAWYNK